MTQPPDPAVPPPMWGPVVITPREVYDAVVRVDALVRAIQLQLVQHTDEHERRDHDVDARLRDHEVRLRARERAAWPLPSIAAIAAIVAIVISVIGLH